MYTFIIHAITYCTIFRSCFSGVFELACVVFFSVIAIPYRYGSAVSLDNTYIHLHAVSRLVGTNCTRKWRFDLNESTAKFDNRTLHHNAPYPSVTVTVDIKFTYVLPP